MSFIRVEVVLALERGVDAVALSLPAGSTVRDAVAASAVLVMGEAAEGRPAALVRGLDWSAPVRPASALVRPKTEDLFR